MKHLCPICCAPKDGPAKVIYSIKLKEEHGLGCKGDILLFCPMKHTKVSWFVRTRERLRDWCLKKLL